jgi:hypothetical protein
VEDEELTQEELKERKIMKLLLKVKNGTPPQRKSALRQLTDKARDFGAEALFNQILPLLMSPTLEDQERHLLVKVWSPLTQAHLHQLRLRFVAMPNCIRHKGDQLYRSD